MQRQVSVSLSSLDRTLTTFIDHPPITNRQREMSPYLVVITQLNRDYHNFKQLLGNSKWHPHLMPSLKPHVPEWGQDPLLTSSGYISPEHCSCQSALLGQKTGNRLLVSQTNTETAKLSLCNSSTEHVPSTTAVKLKTAVMAGKWTGVSR